MRCLLILLMLFAAPALAQTVTVKTGEHGAFTRLVLTYPAPVTWVLGRTDSGYGLQIAGKNLPYDLSSVYRLITRDRLRSIWVDPDSGDLLLGVDCACHAIPFEIGSSTLVIDIKDGAAPQNSSFELSLTNGAVLPPIQPAPTQRPRRNTRREGGYDWLAQTGGAAGRDAETPAPDRAGAGLDADLRLEDFRSMLIDEVGHGATQGVVEMERPTPPPDPIPDTSQDTLPENARSALNALPGIEISTDTAAKPDLMVRGETCPKAADVDVGSWADSADAATELARARATLLTEFDLPDTEGVTRAVNTHLHFGFGAEARLLMTSFLPAGQTDPLRLGLTYLVEGDSPPGTPFLNMQSCDSAAALWALLAAPEDKALPFVNGAAVSRTFLSLPPAMRAALGPETTKRLLASGDSANAEVVRQSFERAAPRDDPSVRLLAAEQALQAGDPARAEAALPKGAAGATGETAMTSLFTLIEARFRQRKAVDGKDILALEAFAFEHGNGPLRPRLDRALSHASALGGDFAAAFAHAGENAALVQDIWALLADLGAESQLLTFAVGPEPAARAALPVATRSKIAARLVAAGLPNAATVWAEADGPDPEIAVRVALANGDARTALRLLSTRLPDVDPDLLATSYAALGDFNAAAATHLAAGNSSGAAQMHRWAGNWDTPPDSADDPWAILAGLLDPGDTAIEAPALRAGQARLEHSADTRRAIADLLESTPIVMSP